jgi:hypothetical protein
VIDIHSKTGQLMSRGSAQLVGSGGADVSPAVQEMKESLNLVRRDLTAVAQKLNAAQPQAQVRCPDAAPVACVSTTLFIVLIVVQLVIMISFLIYRYFSAGNFLLIVKVMCLVISETARRLKPRSSTELGTGQISVHKDHLK